MINKINVVEFLRKYHECIITYSMNAKLHLSIEFISYNLICLLIIASRQFYLNKIFTYRNCELQQRRWQKTIRNYCSKCREAQC